MQLNNSLESHRVSRVVAETVRMRGKVIGETHPEKAGHEFSDTSAYTPTTSLLDVHLPYEFSCGRAAR